MYNRPITEAKITTDIYVGEFVDDRRVGWGIYTLKNGDRYKGQFEKDQMEGRGVYKFSSPSTVGYYLGEFKENAFHGLGRMVFRDGTQYFGSFTNNSMNSARAILKYGNGDTYKGGVSQNMKSDEKGERIYTYSHGDVYQGQFRADKKEGEGKLQIAAQHISYIGEFKDDRKTGKCKLYDFGPAFGRYQGTLNEEEELDGTDCLFEFPAEMDVNYQGEFKDSMIHGKGKLLHLDTGNTFEGTFYKDHKDGPCIFTLAATGQQYKGIFEFNCESATAGSCDYGPRI